MKQTKPTSSFKPLNCIDLFAGAGGFSLAALNAGLSVKVAVEKNKHACDTYRHNLIKLGSDSHLYDTDILELSPSIYCRKTFFRRRQL
jgi:DNA (cytosine-5)-methyltransferase 1